MAKQYADRGSDFVQEDTYTLNRETGIRTAVSMTRSILNPLTMLKAIHKPCLVLHHFRYTLLLPVN